MDGRSCAARWAAVCGLYPAVSILARRDFRPSESTALRAFAMSGYPNSQFPASPQYPGVKPPAGNPFAEQVNPYAAPQVAGYQPRACRAWAKLRLPACGGKAMCS